MQRERVILHSDLNNFFASVECVLNPALKGKPLIVCGDPKKRHGVVLAKNEEAKKYGIKTGDTVYSALDKCPDLQMVQSHHPEYVRFSALVQEIYGRFTEQIEERSIDECALDVTESVQLFGDGETIANKIRQAVKEELGVTVSIGVSFNKVFAKLGSELKKPDAVTVLTRENYRQKIYGLPVTDLWLVGGSMAQKLHRYGIKTIGKLAESDEELLIRIFGKRGRQVWVYARGEDEEPVHWQKENTDTKSVGNSATLPKDATDREEIKRWLYALSESVSTRLKKANVGRASTLHVTVRYADLRFDSWQTKIPPTTLCGDIAKGAYELFCKHCPLGTKIRLLGVTVSGFDYQVEQLSLLGMVDDEEGKMSYEKKERVESAVAKLREKYGYASVQRGLVLKDEHLDGLDVRSLKAGDESKDKNKK